MPTALLSVYHKVRTLRRFAEDLIKLGFNLLGTEGTARYLNEFGVPTRDVAQFVGPPILNHKVATLAREIHAALLADDSPEEQAELARIGIPKIDLVYVELYPLEQEIERRYSTLESVLHKTDIGGLTLLRAAAKGRRIVLSSPAQFQHVLKHIRTGPHAPEACDKFLSLLAFRAENVARRYCEVSAMYHEHRFQNL